MITTSRVRLTGFFSAAALLGVVGLFLVSPFKTELSMPGPLSSNHAQLREDCSACHELTNDAMQSAWHGVSPSSLDLTQSSKCMECHELGGAALNPHGWSASKFEHESGAKLASIPGVPSTESGELACATCHNEHQGRMTNLSLLDNGRCQSCHSATFENFESHTPFDSYPQSKKTNLGFDHASHLLRHFQDESEHSAPTDCTACHVQDRSGDVMQIKSYAESCAACHDVDISGPSSVDGMGVAVLALPAIDTMTLEEQGIAIGQWPADSMVCETPLTPFVRLLLSVDEGLTDSLERLNGVDLLDLMSADEATLVAVEKLTWGVKQLFADLAKGGHAALIDRIERATEGSPINAEQLLAHLPEGLVSEVMNVWMPQAQNELDARANGEVITVEEMPLGEEPDLAADESREEWVGTGGWYYSEMDYTLRYRPTGHADRFMQAWIDLASGVEVAAELFTSIANPAAIGRCTKCHAVVESDNELNVRWLPTGRSKGHGLVRFSHAPHFNSASKNSCLDCHELNREETDFLSAFESRDSAAFARSFKEISVEACAECHSATGASDSCSTCHNYHARGTAPRVPSASFKDLITAE